MKSLIRTGIVVTMFLFAIFLMAGCGGARAPEDTQSTLSGTATKGPLSGATVTVFQLNEDGGRGEVLAVAVTSSDGSYTASGELSGPVAVVVTGGSYVDEASGQTVENDEAHELVTLLAEGADQENIGVTALTTIAAAKASEEAAFGLATAIAAANLDVAEVFGLDGIDIVTTRVADFTDPEAEIEPESDKARYGLVVAGISQVAEDAGLIPEQLMELITNIAQDYSDGVIDNAFYGEPLRYVLKITPAEAIEGLEAAIERFLDSGRNWSGLNPGDIFIEIPPIPEHP